MGDQTSETRSARAWTLARRQHWVVTRGDLLGLGFSPKGIKHRVRTGRLRPVTRGVYAVGRGDLPREGWWMAAVRACGEGAALSHRSAAALWGFASERPGGPVEVSLRRASEVRRRGIKVHRRPTLPASDITSRCGIPVTALVRTFLDIATEMGPRTVERAVNEADKLDLIDPDALRVALDDHAGDPGVRPLRRVLDKHTFRLSDDELELLFRPLAASAGLPVALTKVWLNGFEVDFYWPDVGLVVETDGWRYHRTPAAQTRAARRDQAHTASGLTPLRFSHWQVKHEPAYVRAILTRTIAHLKR